MPNPYKSLPDHAYWRRAVAQLAPADVDPVVAAPFAIGKGDRVATIGSCFAQHISRTLQGEGFGYLVTEREPQTAGAKAENYGVFPARFGNVYTVRQLLQLFQRAYGLFQPRDVAWRRDDGAFIDPFRPRIQEAGFQTIEALLEDRRAHLDAVRRMFEGADVLVFTLGLTEGWLSKQDGAVFPLAPGVEADGDGEYAFENFSVASMVQDLTAFITKLRVLNPGVRVVLTVSPVPLIATYEPKHVLTATTYSKSALRVVAEMVSQAFRRVAYFPSYEIITGPQAGGRFFEDDLREVKPEGVAHVMSIFKRHYLDATKPAPQRVSREPRQITDADRKRMESEYQVVCDEEALDA